MIALTGAAALVGDGLDRVEQATVIIADERIVAVGPVAEVPIPAAAERVDLAGLTVAPGFIDAHVHIAFADPIDVVTGGVTTVRDLGWPPDEIHPLAQRSGSAEFEGPEIICAGPILTAVGGYPTRAAWAPQNTGHEVGNPREARAAVVRTIRAGATVIKIALDPSVGPTFDRSTLASIIDTAHELGWKVTGHVHGLNELEKALDAGLDELAHMLMGHEEIPGATLRRMVAANVVIVPTLSVRFGEDRRTAVENLARYRRAGGTVVYGTDLGNEGPRPGIDPLEVAAMAEADYPVLEIVRSATVLASVWLGLADRGVLAPGKLADLVAFDGRLNDASELTRVTHVWRRGRLRTA